MNTANGGNAVSTCKRNLMREDCVAISGCCYIKGAINEVTAQICFKYNNPGNNVCENDVYDGAAVEEGECLAENIAMWSSAIILIVFLF